MSERFVGAVAVLVTGNNKVLAIPDADENRGKAETLAWYGDFQPVEGGQFAGGRAEGEESELQLLRRETLEEAKIIVDEYRFEELGVGTAIRQQKDGSSEKWFGVNLFKLILSGEEEAQLREQGAVEVNIKNIEQLRPRDQIVSRLYFTRLKEDEHG